MNHIKTLPNGDTEGFSVLITGMVPEQPEALRLADELVDGMSDEHWSQLNAEAATELRRLHAENETLRKAYALLENFAQSVAGSSSFWEDFDDVLEPASVIANFGGKT